MSTSTSLLYMPPGATYVVIENTACGLRDFGELIVLARTSQSARRKTIECPGSPSMRYVNVQPLPELRLYRSHSPTCVCHILLPSQDYVMRLGLYGNWCSV